MHPKSERVRFVDGGYGAGLETGIYRSAMIWHVMALVDLNPHPQNQWVRHPGFRKFDGD
jgi:hypothetical protein